jgi:AraC family transcriptional regulator
MDQPPLDHHYIVQHLGGAKSVQRCHDGASVSTIVELGALTVVPVGTQYKWYTRGPIEFAHLYLAPSLLARAALRFDYASSFSLIECVGGRHPLLEALFGALLAEVRLRRDVNVLYLDSLLDSFVFTMLRDISTAKVGERQPRETLAAFRLARVVEFIESTLDRQITLDDLVAIGGGSVFHFCRAFKNSTGRTPYQFVLRRRIERAKQLLANSEARLDEIATRCGFRDSLHFSKTFSRFAGMPPSRFRKVSR